MLIMKPIEGEEWIEKFRHGQFWISLRRGYPEKLYSRLTRSYVGWWLYFRIHAIWGRAALLLDPLSCGGFYSHLRSFLFNWIVVDIWWTTKHRIWRLFHKQEWEMQCKFMHASWQAMQEGMSDPMPAPPGFSPGNFSGFILGERYFKRVAEILKEEN